MAYGYKTTKTSFTRTSPQRQASNFDTPVTPKTKTDTTIEIEKTSRRRSISRKDTIYITAQLGIMIDSGVSVSEALDCIISQCDKPHVRTALKNILDEVKSGKDFSYAVINCPYKFPHILSCLLRASESSGTMGAMLDRVSEYLDREGEIIRKVRTPMIYPSFMMVITIAAAVLMFTFLLPRFEVIYRGKEAFLPTPTVVALAISNFLRTQWIAITASTGTVIVGTIFYFLSGRGKLSLDWLKLNFPLVGSMFKKFYLARSVRTMGTLIASGITIPESVLLSRDITQNVYFRDLWTQAHSALQAGQGLNDTLFSSNLVPNTVAQMIATGEKTGQMAQIMDRIAKLCEADLDNTVKTVTVMMEPLMILIMGSVVGGIALTVLLPIFKISKLMG